MTAFLSLIDSPESAGRFEAFYNKYIALVLGIAKEKLNSSQPLCEECAQETFLYLAKNFTKVGDLDSPRTRALVGVVASSCAIKIFHREFEKNTRIFIAATQKYEPADFDSFSSLELKSAIDALDDELKNIIYMKFYLGFNNKESSSATGDSEYLVRKKLAKALEDIKENLKEDE